MSATHAENQDARAFLRKLLTLAVPIMIGGSVQTCYQLINMYWVGRIESAAVAIVSVCFPINLLISSIASGLAVATAILISQSFGARDTEKLNHTASQALITMISVSLMFALLLYTLAPAILQIMGIDQTIYSQAVKYVRISSFGIIFVFVCSYYESILRGLGQPKASLRIIVMSVGFNAALDPLLIFGVGSFEGLGVHGAAYATLLTQMLAGSAGICLLLNPRFGLSFHRANFKKNWIIIFRLLRLGLPASIDQAMQALFISVMTVVIAKFGTIALATFGIVFRILMFTVIPAFSISMATAILVGQLTGAGAMIQAARTGKIAALFSFVVMGCVGSIFFLSAEHIISFFVPTDPELIAHATHALKIFSLAFALNATQLALLGYFRGTGDTFRTMLLTLIGTWAIQLPLALMLPKTSLGESGLWWSSTLAATINTAIAWMYFYYRQRTKYYRQRTKS